VLSGCGCNGKKVPCIGRTSGIRNAVRYNTVHGLAASDMALSLLKSLALIAPMILITRSIDQAVLIGTNFTPGNHIVISPTDIDEKTVRLVAQGRVIGGPSDGALFKSAHELSPGQSISVGPLVRITVVDLLGEAVRLGIDCPQHIGVVRKEELSQTRNKER